MPKKRFMVIGIGALGESVAQALAEGGAEVIAVDNSPVNVENIKDRVSVAVQADGTDKKALEQLGAADLDAAVMCIGEEFEAAVLVTASLLDLGVKHVAARANSPMASSILRRLGAHDVFYVESVVGNVIARRLNRPEISHEMEIGGGYRILEWKASPKLIGCKLIELELPKRFGVHVVAIHHVADMEHIKTAGADSVIEDSDLMILSGHERDLEKFFSYYAATE